MNLAVIVLGILYLCDAPVGNALAVCAISESVVTLIVVIYNKHKNKH